MSVLLLISDASLTPCYAMCSLRKVPSSSCGQTRRDLWVRTSADAESGGGVGLLCEAEGHGWVLHGTTCAGVCLKEKSLDYNAGPSFTHHCYKRGSFLLHSKQVSLW